MEATWVGLGDRLGFGTSVGAYLTTQFAGPGPAPQGAPSGAAVASGTTNATTGALALSGLAEETDYVLYAVGKPLIRISTKTNPRKTMGTFTDEQVAVYDATTELVRGVDQSSLAVDLSNAGFTGATAGQVPAWDAVLGKPVPRAGTFVNVMLPPYNAIGDGTSHPLSERFASLAAAQAVYPHAGALTDEIDWAAWQLASNNVSSALGATLYGPYNTHFVFNKTLAVDDNGVTVAGEGMGATKVTLAAGTTTLRNVIRFNTSLSGTPPRLTNCAIRDITVDANGGETTWTAGGIPGPVTFYAVDGVSVSRVEVLNGRDYCINTVGCTRQSVRDCVLDTCYAQGASNPLNIGASTTVDSSDAIVIGNRVLTSVEVTITSVTTTANTATFTTAAAHKMSATQAVKITGVDVVAYNGWWSVVTVPTPTTFTVALGSTPADGTGGTLKPICDKGIYLGGKNFTRLVCSNNIVSDAFGAISAETNTPGSNDMTVTGNVVCDFWDHGIGLSDHSSATAANYFQRGVCTGNIVRGVDGTTAFGRAGSGSIRGILMHGDYIRAEGNIITNVVLGVEAGLNLATDEAFIAINDNTIVTASDGSTNSNGAAIRLIKGQASNTLRYVQVRGNQIDGQASATSTRYGIYAAGAIQEFDISNNQVRGMGRTGIYLLASAGVAPTRGGIHNNRVVDCNSSSAASVEDQVGIRIDGACSDITLSRNKAYDTRGTKLQTYGLRVASGATGIRDEDNEFTGNLTGEVSDATNGVGLTRFDSRAQQHFLPLGFPLTSSAVNWSAAGRTLWWRIPPGWGRSTIAKVWQRFSVVDGATPGTTDQVCIAIHANNGSVGDAAAPGTQKWTSGTTTASLNGGSPQEFTTGGILVQSGDWIALRVASATTRVEQNSGAVANGNLLKGMAGYTDSATMDAATGVATMVIKATSPPLTANGTSLNIPVMRLLP